MSSFMSMISQVLNVKLFPETNIENKLTLKHPSECPIPSLDELDENTEVCFPSPVLIPVLKLYENKSLTSFITDMDYLTLYNCIFENIYEYEPYFDKFEHYWMIIEKKKKKHSAIKICLFETYEGNILIEFQSSEKNNKFWKIYKIIKDKCGI